MKFIKGDPNSPVGSLITFSEVRGQNPIEPDAKILAVHIVVSPLTAHNYNYPVVVFPVTAFSDKKHLFKVLDFIGNCDVIQLEDFQIPDNQSEEEYLKKRMKMLNDVVKKYVDAFQKKYSEIVEEQDLAIFDYLMDFDKIVGTKKNPSSNKIKKKKNQLENPEDILSSLKGIEQLLLKKEKELQKTKQNQRKTRLSSNQIKTRKKINKSMEEFIPYISFIKMNHPEIDIINFEKALQNNDFQLANLYLKKYFAIIEERYETAQYFQNKIKNFELNQ